VSRAVTAASPAPDLAAQRRGALRTALALGALALAFFVAAFLLLPR
jgi:hypothetical protein